MWENILRHVFLWLAIKILYRYRRNSSDVSHQFAALYLTTHICEAPRHEFCFNFRTCQTAHDMHICYSSFSTRIQNCALLDLTNTGLRFDPHCTSVTGTFAMRSVAYHSCNLLILTTCHRGWTQFIESLLIALACCGSGWHQVLNPFGRISLELNRGFVMFWNTPRIATRSNSRLL